jgi:hypothetical protein
MLFLSISESSKPMAIIVSIVYNRWSASFWRWIMGTAVVVLIIAAIIVPAVSGCVVIPDASAKVPVMKSVPQFQMQAASEWFR